MRPKIDSSPPYSRIQNSYESTATGAARWASPSPMVRPNSGNMPNIEKVLAVVCSTATCCGRPRPSNVRLVGHRAAIDSNVVRRANHSWYSGNV